MKGLLTFVITAGLIIGPSFAFANCGNDNGNGNGCSGEQGPVGPQGPQGDPGLNGQDGANGQNGKDGKDGQAPVGINDVKVVADTALRLYDGKRVQLQVFNIYAFGARPGQDVFGHGRNFMYGVRAVFKLGKSHEERLLEKQQAEINALRRALNAR